jgi:predicted MFS family arabinose efflux permease
MGFIIGGLVSQAYGWRVAFMAVGIPGVLFAIVFALTVKEPQRGRWESDAEAAYNPTLRETITALSSFSSFWFLADRLGVKDKRWYLWLPADLARRVSEQR